MGRKLWSAAGTVLLVTAVTVVLFEIAVRFVVPQAQLYPRYRYSERYGHLLPESATIVHEKPGAWRFVYNTNEFGYRVSMPEISNRYDLPGIVILGDSVTFGQGVNDGEEYPAVLAKPLAAQAHVVNLGMPSFGLTHQIRTFYEFGLLFQPAAVVLQFSSNDPDNNLYERVTTVQDGRFKFHRDRSMGRAMSAFKQFLSGSIVQRSAAYNFVRNYAYAYWQGRVVGAPSADNLQRREAFYNELLNAFASDLKRRGIALLLIDVPGHLARWPGIKSEAEALDRAGLLRYLRTEPWFAGLTDYGTPEGHPWGPKGHRVVAEHLLGPLRAALAIGGSEPLPQAAHARGQ
jgi:lysophospholipase L1-like esterase